ncbi:hypothetical protein, partial [Salmonella enterica]|uniref:hypothetical protein n=1 Tax=Salmonella enterica TaxID=28901 RepID=UPI00262FA072
GIPWQKENSCLQSMDRGYPPATIFSRLSGSPVKGGDKHRLFDNSGEYRGKKRTAVSKAWTADIRQQPFFQG